MLLNLVVEVLSQELNQATTTKKIDLFTMGRAKTINHLLFADDLLIFSKANFKSINSVKVILRKFANYSRLAPNPAKSNIHFSVTTLGQTRLAAVLGYLIKSLPIKHLGKELGEAECHDLIDQLRSTFAKWRTKNLSYACRIQLAKWLFYGKLSYRFQSILIPKGVLDDVRKITYNFIQDGKNSSIKRRNMTQGRKNSSNNGYHKKDHTNLDSGRHPMGIVDEGKYVKGMGLNLIQTTYSQSPMWASILRAVELTEKCVICRPGYRFEWKGKGSTQTKKNIYETIAHPSYVNPLVEGIWVNKSSKMSVTLWRLRWNCLHTFERLKLWRTQVPEYYTLREEEDESPDHLFINCRYTRKFQLDFTELMRGVLWRIMEHLNPTTRDLQVGEVIKGIHRFKKHTPCWGLSWITLSAFTWHVWLEQNRRFRQDERKTVVIIFKLMISDIDIIYSSSKFKDTPQSSLEAGATKSWIVGLSKIVDYTIRTQSPGLVVN